MNMFKNLPIAARLSVGFSALLMLLLLTTAAGLWGLRSVHDTAANALQSDVLRAQATADIRILVLTARRCGKRRLHQP